MGVTLSQRSTGAGLRLQGAETLLSRSPLQTAALRWTRRRLRVLAYHAVPDPKPFAAQLDWLCANASPVSLGAATEALLHGRTLPDRAVLLTFDDGDRSVFDAAAPELRERGIPAVAYVVAGVVDTDTPLWWTEVEHLVRVTALSVTPTTQVRRLKWLPDTERRRTIDDLRARTGSRLRTPQLTSDELRKLEIDDIAVGNHSLTHPCLDRCGDEVIRDEVRTSHELLSGMLGHPPASFAYPNGNWDARVKAEVRRAGYSVAFAFDHRLVAPSPDPLSVSRVRVDSAARVDRFRILVSGLHPAIHALRGRP